jgi:ribosomal protein S12 methylthiotransferase
MEKQGIRGDKVSVVTLGCEKNTVDTEVLMGLLRRRGLELAPDAESANTVIINTCGFIDVAKKESIDAVLGALELKKQGIIERVYVAGCLSERYPAELTAELPDVDKFFGTQDFERILEEVAPHTTNAVVDLKRDLIGERVQTTPRHYAYMKISEGCDNPCSFCAIPIMRGGHRSKSIEELEFEAMMLAANGVKEIILIAQDSTYYGLDLYGSRSLAKLLTRLARIPNIEWIRLMYAYPAKFPLDILDVIAGEEKIAKYLDIPVQHASTDVLKSMRRGITRRATEELIHKIRERVPNITLRTTLITGYPAEGEKEYKELYQFVEEMQFDRLGVFTYSQEEGTTAHPLGDPVLEEEKRRRQAELYDLQRDISLEKNLQKVGRTMRVLVEREEDGFFYGRTEADAPEIDGEVKIITNESGQALSVGEFVNVGITGASDYELEANWLPAISGR